MAATLSAREGAGLYLVRRARTLTAPHQLRMVATAFVGVLVVDLGRIHLSRLSAGESVAWAPAACELLCYVAIALVLWRPVAGLWLAGSVLLASLAVGGTGLEPLTLLVVGGLVGARGSRRLLAAFGAMVACLLLANIAVHPGNWAFFLGWFGGVAALGTTLGLALRQLGRVRDGEGRHQAEVVTEDARLRADERRLLARELHDVVTHQLSNISLQVMSHLDSTDPDDLRKVLKKVNRSTDSALTELRLLVRVLRDNPTTAAGADEVGELSQRIPPTQRAAGWARELTDAGFDPVIEVPAQADRLEGTVQGTITRTLDVICDNILHHSPALSWCTITVSVNPSQVVVRAASPLPSPPLSDPDALGWGLRGLRERVDLTGGVFSAGPSSGTADPQWVVVVTLPHD